MTARFSPEGELEKLYLLEVLVDNLHLETSKVNLADQAEASNKATCVIFKFLNHPPLKICEGDFCEKDENYEHSFKSVTYRSGKSCLFSLRNSAPPLAYFQIKLFVEVSKDEPPNLVIGKGCADLGGNFLKILNCTTKDCELGPITQSVRDKYPILNDNNEEIGNINVFIRLSCFGKMIITQFQIADEEKETFFFKGNEKKVIDGAGEGSAVAPCDPTDSKRIPCSDKDIPDPAPKKDTAAEPPEPKPPNPPAYAKYPPNPQHGGLLGGFGGRPGVTGAYGGFGGQPFPYGPPTGLLGGNPDFAAGMPPFPDPRLQQSQQFGMPPFPDPRLQQSQQFGTPTFPDQRLQQGQQFDMNFQKSPNSQAQKHPFCGKIQLRRESSSDEEEEVEQTPPQQVPLLNFCSCDYPLPPGFTMPLPPPPKKKKKKKKPTCPFDLGGKFCLMPKCPMGYPLYKRPGNPNPNQMEPDEIALMDDRVILQMAPLRHQSPFPMQQQSPFPIQQQSPFPMQQQPPFPMQQLPMPYPMGPPPFGLPSTADPRDLYSLRVGRVMTGAEQNSKVEVAFQSTVEPPRKPCRHHAETQYIPEDFGGLSEPPKVDKGKKAKGKEQKKGKK